MNQLLIIINQLLHKSMPSNHKQQKNGLHCKSTIILNFEYVMPSLCDVAGSW